MPDADLLVHLPIFFQKSDLVVTFLIVAMAAGYFFRFEPVAILANLGIVLFLLCVGLEAGPSFFRAFKQHGRRFIYNVLVLLSVAGINTVAIIALSGIPIGIGLGLFAGAFSSSPALISALQFSPEEQVIFGYGVAYPFGLLGVIVFISVSVRVLRPRMEAELRGRSRLHSAVFKLDNEDLHGRLLRDVELFDRHDVVVSGILRDLPVRSASGGTVLQKGDILRLEGLPENVEATGKEIGEPVQESFDEQAELDTRSIVVEKHPGREPIHSRPRPAAALQRVPDADHSRQHGVRSVRGSGACPRRRRRRGRHALCTRPARTLPRPRKLHRAAEGRHRLARRGSLPRVRHRRGSWCRFRHSGRSPSA